MTASSRMDNSVLVYNMVFIFFLAISGIPAVLYSYQLPAEAPLLKELY